MDLVSPPAHVCDPDEPTGPLEGGFQTDDEGDPLDASERAALEAALVTAHLEAQAGRTRPAREFLRELRRSAQPSSG